MAIIKDILLGAEKRKANLSAMCEELEINPADLYQSEIQVPFEKVYKTWEIVLRHTNDPLLGLHLGEQTNPSIMGLVGYLMQCCPNLEEAFKSVCSFSALATDMVTYSLSKVDGFVKLNYKACDQWIKISPDGARNALDQSLAGTLNVFSTLSGKRIYPRKVELTARRPKDFAEYERVFQAPIQWNAKSNTMTFGDAQLSATVVSYDESLMGVFCDLIKKRFEKIEQDTFENLVKREIMTTFKGQLPSIESMAARFNMTVRSFQRKLDEENISYRKLCKELGKDFASTLLSRKNIKIAEVALALGYSDARAFQRAFKVWTGTTPGEFRASLKLP